MKATVRRGSKKRLKTAKEATRDVGKAGKRTTKTVTRIRNYPIAETLQWVADGERLLIKWGAIKSPNAKRIANAVAGVLGVLQALTELQKK